MSDQKKKTVHVLQMDGVLRKKYTGGLSEDRRKLIGGVGGEGPRVVNPNGARPNVWEGIGEEYAPLRK